MNFVIHFKESLSTLTCLEFLEQLGVVLLVVIFFIYFFCPIRRNRYFYGNKNAFAALVVSLLVVLGSVFAFSGWNQVKTFVHPTELLPPHEKEIVNSAANGRPQSDASFSAEDNLYAVLSQFLDPGNLPSATGNGRRWAVILAFAGIILLSGVLVSTLVSYLSKKSDKWKNGLIHYGSPWSFGVNKYVVIIGVNELTAAIVKHSLSSGASYVLIQTRQDVAKMRDRLDLRLDRHDEKRVVFYYGERTSEEDIRALRPERCREVYILGEDLNFEDEKDHDSYNVKCVELIGDRLKRQRSRQVKLLRRKQQLRCHVNFEYQGTFTSFKATHHYADLQKTVIFKPFNVHDIWAKKVLVDNFAVIPGQNKGELDVQRYLPIDSYRDNNKKTHYITKDNVDGNAKSVHMVIIGMNQMGTALGVQTALMAHYPNFMSDRNLRTTITFIDEHAVKEGEFFRGRFEALFNLCRYRTIICNQLGDNSIDLQSGWIDPLNPKTKEGFFKHLGKEVPENSGDYNFMDIQWEFIQGNAASKEVADYLRLIAEVDTEADDKKKTTTIAICFNDPQQTIATALYLPGKVVRSINQLLVYQQKSFDLLGRVAQGESDWKRYKNLFPFGMIDGAYTGEELENTSAKIQNYLFSHNADRGRLYDFDSTLLEPINDSWSELGMILRQANIDMAESIPAKLRAIRGKEYKGNPNNIDKALSEDVIEAMAYSEHLRWVTQKLIGGFRPLYKNEIDEVVPEEGLNKELKELYKRTKRAHLDICSKEQLEEYEPGLFEPGKNNDENVIKNLSLILRCAEWANRKSARKNSLVSSIITGSCGLRYIQKGKQGNVTMEHSRWMCALPVTRFQWYQVTGKDRPSLFAKNLPKVNVSKEDIDDFLLILRKRTGLYFALPSLKEWEYVARNTASHLPKISLSWWLVICFNRWKWLWEVGHLMKQSHRLQKNDFGIHELLGNVWEWTREGVDGHDNCFYFCGGSWRFKEIECDMSRPYWNSYWDSGFRSDDLGFRLVWKSDTTPSDISSVKAKHGRKIIKEDIKKWIEAEGRWAKVEDGYFIMGSDDINAGPDESPRHFVRIKEPFEMCSIPVTQEFWNIVLRNDVKDNPAPITKGNLPQTCVSFKDVNRFLKRLNAMTSDGYAYRLPTEAEWEYAAKGGHLAAMANAIRTLIESRKDKKLSDDDIKQLDKNIRLSYSIFAGSDKPVEVAWFRNPADDKAIATTQLVKQKAPNELGLYDMSGNIWEWVEDYYQLNFYEACKEKKEYLKHGYVTNPRCDDRSYSAHVFRGGSYLFEQCDSRCTKPSYWIDSYRTPDLGFRLVRTLKKK